MSASNTIIYGKKTASTNNLFNNITTTKTSLKINKPTQINKSINTLSKLSVLEQLNQILSRHALILLECYALSDLGKRYN